MKAQPGQHTELNDERKVCLLCGETVHQGACYDQTNDSQLTATVALKLACFLLIGCGTVMLVIALSVIVMGGAWRFALLMSAVGILPFVAGICGLAASNSNLVENLPLAMFTAFTVCGVVFHTVVAILLLVDQSGMRSALLTSICPAGVHCGDDVSAEEDVYDSYEEVLLFGSLIIVGFEVLAAVTLWWHLSLLEPEVMFEHETSSQEAAAEPMMRHAAVAYMTMDDRVQMVASVNLDTTEFPCHEETQHMSTEDLATVTNRITMRCLDQGAQGLYGVLSQKLQIFSGADIPSRNQSKEFRYPQQFLCAWVDLTGDPERTVTVGGLSTSISHVCFSEQGSVDCKAVAMVVAFDKEYPRHLVAHLLYSALHEPQLSCGGGGAWTTAERDQALTRVSALCTKKVNHSRRCSRDEQQVVIAVDRLRRQNIEGILDRNMARILAEQEQLAAKLKHEAAVKRQFNRSLNNKKRDAFTVPEHCTVS